MASSSSSSSSSSTPWSSRFQDSEEINQDGKVLIKLSDRKPVFIVPDIFREKVYINIREYYIKKSESEEEEEEEEGDEVPYLLPTKRGVCFTEEEFDVFCDKISRVKSLVKRLRKKNQKASNKRRHREEFQDSDRKKSR